MRGGFGICVTCLLVCLSGEAFAQQPTWLQRGREALMERDATTARWAFGQGLDQARDIETRWRLLLGLALANELEGATLEAVYAYRRFLTEVRRETGLAERAPWPGRRERALSDVRRLEAELMGSFAKVALDSTPSGATVTVDGDATEQVTPAVLYLPAGRHQIRLELEGYRDEHLVIDAAAGDLPLLEPKLELLPPDPEATSMWLPLTGALSVGLGGALVIAGGALHASALSAVDELESLPPVPESIPRDETLRDRVMTYEAAFITSYIAGGALVATGVGLLVADAVTDSGKPSTTSAFVAPHTAGFVAGVGGVW